jgi:hypothetical protein
MNHSYPIEKIHNEILNTFLGNKLINLKLYSVNKEVNDSSGNEIEYWKYIFHFEHSETFLKFNIGHPASYASLFFKKTRNGLP